jgi:hypothetical protein
MTGNITMGAIRGFILTQNPYVPIGLPNHRIGETYSQYTDVNMLKVNTLLTFSGYTDGNMMPYETGKGKIGDVGHVYEEVRANTGFFDEIQAPNVQAKQISGDKARVNRIETEEAWMDRVIFTHDVRGYDSAFYWSYPFARYIVPWNGKVKSIILHTTSISDPMLVYKRSETPQQSDSDYVDLIVDNDQIISVDFNEMIAVEDSSKYATFDIDIPLYSNSVIQVKGNITDPNRHTTLIVYIVYSTL